jgi:hypothetical protein
VHSIVADTNDEKKKNDDDNNNGSSSRKRLVGRILQLLLLRIRIEKLIFVLLGDNAAGIASIAVVEADIIIFLLLLLLLLLMLLLILLLLLLLHPPKLILFIVGVAVVDVVVVVMLPQLAIHAVLRPLRLLRDPRERKTISYYRKNYDSCRVLLLKTSCSCASIIIIMSCQ